MKRRWTRVLALGIGLALPVAAMAAPALADQVTNTIDATPDSNLEVVTIAPGGSTSVGFQILAAQSGGPGGVVTDPTGDVAGCNATTGSPATVTFSVPSGVSMTPATNQLVFTACDTTISASFSSSTVGSYTISVASVTGGRSGSLWNTAPASFTLNVVSSDPCAGRVAPGAPTLSETNSPDATGWYNESSPAAKFTISPSTNAEYSYDGGTTWNAYSGEVTLGADGEYSITARNFLPATTSPDCPRLDGAVAGPLEMDVDRTDPTISSALDRAPASSGWFNNATGAPVLQYTCGDSLSGVATCPADYTFGEGEDQSRAAQTVTDNAGNSNTGGAISDVDVDLTDPTISSALDRAPASSGWFNNTTGAPVLEYTCGDSLSGVASCPTDYTFGEGEDQSRAAQTVTDNAGNSNTGGAISDVDVDLTDPGLTWNGGPADGSTHYFGFVPGAPTCSATDALSGPKDCNVTGYGNTVGSHTMTATARDNALNSHSANRSYTVNGWNLTGFYQPVDMNGVYNVVKSGSTVPLKFEVFAGTTELTQTWVVDTFVAKQIDCETSADMTAVEFTTTGGTSLRYDENTGQFVQNWQTPRGKGGLCYKVTLTTDDGSSLVAYFRLK
jgi:hypothetical protein